MRVGDLSVAAEVSATHLVQQFKALVGVTPKRLARSYRFAATVLALDPAEPIDWADVAAGAGCFDQVHFGHEFREFTGFTPTRYVEVRRTFLRNHPGHVLDGWLLPADPTRAIRKAASDRRLRTLDGPAVHRLGDC